MCIEIHLINSIESIVSKTSERIFDISDEYEIVPETSAQSCVAILAEHVIKKLLSSKKITYRPPLVTAMASLHMNNRELSHESSVQSGTCQSLFSPENPVFYNLGF